MDLFRAFLVSNEHSRRALMLSEKVIRVNAANYIAWYFRRQVLKQMPELWRYELDFCQDISSFSPKNYQLWYHRRMVVSELEDPSRELEHCHSVISEDSKNYHAWAHRQWVISEFNLFKDELDYTVSLLIEDPRNNSAWNHRWFSISKTSGWDLSTIRNELEFSFGHVRSLPFNESPWNYITGLVECSQFNPDVCTEVIGFAEDILCSHSDCYFSASVLVDVLEVQKTTASLKPNNNLGSSGANFN